ncbi:S1C family serine protease [Oceanobacillus sp. M60]|uniref:Serine protease Do-like HtrA n=1 Tax=Oceanobacillus oncorhynchi TaxID=545501 RepID=A0A0A1MMN0_9BACI|nr:trypsin-like peptidase domain-containing protein [Oceanobacillus oncorhynchi]UUI39993.1 trypsin-like peptidase domain-containing protein [Oceanobacillus oncorhynchi]CEI80341.1 Serine protease Do-like HtrA [Oceanobacillus oncorhynchi]
MEYNDQPNQPQPGPDKKNKGKWLIPLLLGIIIGGILVLLINPDFLRNENTAQISPAGEEENNENADSNGILEDQPMQVDVSTQLTEIIEQVTPAVVGITNIQQNVSWGAEADGIEAGTGSGVIYKVEDGETYIVTNHHVIEDADSVEVILHDETHMEAEIIGSDLFTDLAVLKMDNENEDTPMEIGTSESLKVGEPAIAIGNPLGAYLSSTVTQGVISGMERTIPMDFNFDGQPDWQAEVIQTDAAINPGNSGGALINLYGQLIGINSMKINEEAVEGIGFAIPIDSAIPVIQELEENGEVVRPFLGVEIYSIEELPQYEWRNTLQLPVEVEGGVYVWSVENLSPADEAGIQQYDVIVALDGVPVHNTIDLRKILYEEKEVGEVVTIDYYRDGELMQTELELEIQ